MTASVIPDALREFVGIHIGYILLTMASAIALPFGILMAILQYRLYDIEVIIRRTLQYSLLTAMLGLIYFGSVVFFEQVFRPFTGQTSAAIVVSTLFIAALFQPVRRRLQYWIDRRFFRKQYDIEQTLSSFAASLRNEVDLEELRDHLLNVVQETVQPESMSLWMAQLPAGRQDQLTGNGG
jgi:hypothetical protein